MTAKWIETITGPLDQKKQYRATRARLASLPEPYAATAEAIHRYVLMYSGITDGDTLVRMLADFADLWERSAIDQTPVDEVVGGDPVAFAEEFSDSYTAKQWIDKERARLVRAFEAARRSDPQ